MRTIYRLILLLILATCLVVAGIIAFNGPDEVIQTVNKERALIAAVMGSQAEERAVDRTNSVFASMRPLILESIGWFSPGGNVQRIANAVVEKRATSLQSYYRRGVNTFWDLVYQALQRIFVLLELAPLIALLTVPAAVDGWSVRAIRISSFGYTSPAVYQGGLIALSCWITGLLVLFTIPVALPLSLFLGWAIAFALLVRSIVANFPRKL